MNLLELGEIRVELDRVRESSDQVRRGIFARYNEFTRTLEAKYVQLENEVSELRRIIETAKG